MHDVRSQQRVVYAREVIAYSKQGRLSCRGVDLGHSGLLVLPPQGVEPVDSPLKLNLPLSGGATVVVEGMVEGTTIVRGESAWEIRFNRMPTSMRAQLLSYLRERSSQPAAPRSERVTPRPPTGSNAMVMAAPSADDERSSVSPRERIPQTGPHRAATGTLLGTPITSEQLAALKDAQDPTADGRQGDSDNDPYGRAKALLRTLEHADLSD